MASRKSKKVESRADAFNNAAIKIQCAMRRCLAKKRVAAVSREHWERTFDPKVKKYFFYNKITGESVWKVPFLMALYEDKDVWAAIQIERIVRGFLGRRKMRRAVRERYSKFYDGTSNTFYYLDKETDSTFWNPSPWLQRQDIRLSKEDQALFDT
jgi:hypothetical protein